MSTPGYTITTWAIGPADTMLSAAELARALSDLPQCEGALPAGLDMPRRTSPRNDMVIGGLIAVVGLLGSAVGIITAEAVKDFYKVVILPRYKPWLDKISATLPGTPGALGKAVSVVLHYEAFGVSVRVDSVGATYADAARQAHLIEDVHANAVAWILTNGPGKRVHYYRIADGKVNAEPMMYDHVLQIGQ